VEYVARTDSDQLWDWEQVNQLPWTGSRSSSRTIDWTMTPEPGVHYLQIFVADGAGNISEPALVFTNYQPTTTEVALDAARVYRIQPPSDTTLTVQMTALTGNPDLYVVSDDFQLVPTPPTWDLSEERFTFTTDGGIYQIEIDGYESQLSSFALDVTLNPGLNALAPTFPGSDLDRRPRGSIISFRSYEPGARDARLPAPPLVDWELFLPQLMHNADP
jgi:hypothetical protein